MNFDVKTVLVVDKENFELGNNVEIVIDTGYKYNSFITRIDDKYIDIYDIADDLSIPYRIIKSIRHIQAMWYLLWRKDLRICDLDYNLCDFSIYIF